MRAYTSFLLLILSAVIFTSRAEDEVIAPEGVSKLQAFIALYNNAQVIGMGTYHPQSGKALMEIRDILRTFALYCNHGNCDYVRGTMMRTDFNNYPRISTKYYDQQYGEGAARRALEKADSIDTRGYTAQTTAVCDLFSSADQSAMSDQAKEEFGYFIKQCNQHRETDERVAKIPAAQKIKGCRVSYQNGPGFNSFQEKNVPCDQAAADLLATFNRLASIDRMQARQDADIALSVSNVTISDKTHEPMYQFELIHFKKLANLLQRLHAN